MKVLVTGGAGFIGSNFVHLVLAERPEWEVVNLDKLTYAGNPENLRDVEDDRRDRFVKGDICDEQAVGEVARLLGRSYKATESLRSRAPVAFQEALARLETESV